MLKALIICIAMSLQGCVSLAAQGRTAKEGKECSFPLYTYGGAVNSIRLFAATAAEIPKRPEWGAVSAVVAVDFPFTVAMDTIALPVSVARDITECAKKYTTKKPKFKKTVERKSPQLKKLDEKAVSQEVEIFWYETNEPMSK